MHSTIAYIFWSWLTIVITSIVLHDVGQNIFKPPECINLRTSIIIPYNGNVQLSIRSVETNDDTGFLEGVYHEKHSTLLKVDGQRHYHSMM